MAQKPAKINLPETFYEQVNSVCDPPVAKVGGAAIF